MLDRNQAIVSLLGKLEHRLSTTSSVAAICD